MFQSLMGKLCICNGKVSSIKTTTANVFQSLMGKLCICNPIKNFDDLIEFVLEFQSLMGKLCICNRR